MCVGRVAQFCHMQDDLACKGFGNLGLFLSMLPGSLLGLSNCGHKQGISPQAGVTMQIHIKQCEETWLQICNAGSACVGRRGC